MPLPASISHNLLGATIGRPSTDFIFNNAFSPVTNTFAFSASAAARTTSSSGSGSSRRLDYALRANPTYKLEICWQICQHRTMSRDTRVISWIKAARREFGKFPQGAQTIILRALTIAAEGSKVDIARPMRGFGAGVIEVALAYRSDAYRTVYAVKLGEDIWVVHAFQKKSTRGVKTPQREIDLIRARISQLKEQLR